LSRILQPFKGLGEIEFGMTLDQLKQLTGIHNTAVRDRHLKQEQLADGPTVYVLENGTLVTIEVEYQSGVHFKEADLFATADVIALLEGHKIERKRDVMHIKELGLVLFSFQAKDPKKRVLWFYSKEMISELDNVLDVA
jgi:hypothetical protein